MSATYRKISASNFNAWLRRAKPGEQMEYHYGKLAIDRIEADDADRIDALANAARHAAGYRLVKHPDLRDAKLEQNGPQLVYLTQQTNHTDQRRRHSYLATRSSVQAVAQKRAA